MIFVRPIIAAFPALLLALVLCGCSTPDHWGNMEKRYADKSSSAAPVLLDGQRLSDWDNLPPLPYVTNGALRLSLEQAVMLTLERNRSLLIERYEPMIDGAFEQIERGQFDPELYGEGKYYEETATETSRSTSERFDVKGEDIASELGIRQRLPIGTELDASVGYTRLLSDRTPEQHEARLGLSITQALLEGLGPAVNLIDVRLAELETAASRYELRGFVEALVAETEMAYWKVVLARKETEIVQRSRDVAQQQLHEIKQRIDVGAQPRSAAAAVEAEVALRQQALIEGHSIQQDRRLRLLRLANAQGGDQFNLDIEPSTEPETLSPPLGDFQERMALADRLRSDLAEARLRKEQRRLEVIRTRDGLLPKIDFFVDLGKTGFADKAGDAFGNIDGDTYDFAAGLRLSADLVGRKPDGRDLVVRARDEQAALAIENMANLIELEVRLAINECERTRQQITAGAVSMELQRQSLEVERQRFEVGDSTSLLVARAQRDFLASELAHISAIVNYRIALVKLYLAEGSLLERRGIRLQ